MKQLTDEDLFFYIGDIDLYDVESDGNCMYSSIEHILQDGVDSRAKTARWLKEHPVHEADCKDVLAAILPREAYASATHRPLQDVREPFIASWDEYVEYNSMNGVWVEAYALQQLKACYKADGYTLRIWRACFEEDFRLFEGDTEVWKEAPGVLSRYSLIQLDDGGENREPAGKCGFLDILHYGRVHFRPLNTKGADPKSAADILSMHHGVDVGGGAGGPAAAGGGAGSSDAAAATGGGGGSGGDGASAGSRSGAGVGGGTRGASVASPRLIEVSKHVL